MSKFMKGETDFDCTVEELQEAFTEIIGEVPRSKVKVEHHEEAQHLYGYRSDKRPEVANLIFRTPWMSSNDIGFKQGDGTWECIISQYDRGVLRRKGITNPENAIKVRIALRKAERRFARKGVSTRRVVRGNVIALEAM